ncbi:ribbon-helix-helix protein, CopG family [Antribacter sp. KLBMP9083]|uniref:Ribbon-helix-helix protein, CopG family n=1 Tax=Antribacter soli TaxID=2910976 RepID=A0AA41QC36_9MICO|nr:ribbon-helix-helix protein, CopG family [Antribacter soli]MCF4120715.1 ribbon-helix-helix protein, CopG family [Antribacter soli]
MVLKRTTVMVDEEDLRAVKAIAEREGRPEAELIREAFHLVALRGRRWDDDWAIPEFDFGGPVSADDVGAAVRDGISDT